MKYLATLFFLVFTVCLLAQDQTGGELNVRIINNPQSKLVTITLELVSSLCWDANQYNEDHNITELFTGTTLAPSSSGWKEFYACWESYSEIYDSTFGLGYYIVGANVYEQDGYSNHYFYIDYRTSDLPENFGTGGNGDVNVDFNVATGKFFYYLTQTEFPTYTTIWDQKAWIHNITTELEPLPPTDLEQTASSGNPVLEWQHAAVTPNWRTGYKIYRSVPNPYNFAVIGSVSENINTFTDESVLLGGGGPAYYKVTAINGTRESVFSNTIYVIINMAEKSNCQGENTVESYNQLNQNFPNPFNPYTNITFSLKENTLVTLKVYDILGKEVSVLIYEMLNQGSHKVEFNGSDLESGIYFYEIRADNFRDVKKLILLK
jgi:hypothetical protein